MKRNCLYILAIAGILGLLIISSVTPVMAASSLTSTTTNVLGVQSIFLGAGVMDSATVKGPTTSSPTPTGTVSFQVSKGTAAFATFSTVTLSGGMAYSAAYRPTSAGSYRFRTIYNGNTNYLGSTSANVQLMVNKASSQTTISVGSTSMNLGGYVNETVWVSGLGGAFPLPAGTVNFQVRQGLSGAWVTYKSNVPLNSWYPVSASYKPSTSGNWYFRAVYSGDANYVGSTSSVITVSVKSSTSPRR